MVSVPYGDVSCFLTSNPEPSASIPENSGLTSTSHRVLSPVSVSIWSDDGVYMRKPLSKNCIVLFEISLLMQSVVMACLRSLALERKPAKYGLAIAHIPSLQSLGEV